MATAIDPIDSSIRSPIWDDASPTRDEAGVRNLVPYNLLFVLPLAGISIIGYLGVKSEYMGNFLCPCLAKFRLAMTVPRTDMGVLVIATV